MSRARVCARSQRRARATPPNALSAAQKKKKKKKDKEQNEADES